MLIPVLYKFTKLIESDVHQEDPSDKTKYDVTDYISSEMKPILQKFLKKNGLSPNHYYPEDVSDDQAIKRYLGVDKKNYSVRVAALSDKNEILGLIDSIPLKINDGELKVYASYVYGDPTSDSKTNQKMIEKMLDFCITNPDKSVKWIVFNDLSKHDNRRWINELEKFGFIQPYRFTNPTYKDTVVLVHVLRTNAGRKYPITVDTDVRNAPENLPENVAQEEMDV